MTPRAIPVAAPVIKPRMVTLVMEVVLPTNRKPATPIHKVQRTMRMFMVYSKRQRDALIAIAAGVPQRRVTFQSGKDRITVRFSARAD